MSDQHTSLVSLSAYAQAVPSSHLRDGHQQQQQQVGTAVYGLADPSRLERGSMSSLSHSSDRLSSAVREDETKVHGIFPKSHLFVNFLSGSYVAFQSISVNAELGFCCSGCQNHTASL